MKNWTDYESPLLRGSRLCSHMFLLGLEDPFVMKRKEITKGVARNGRYKKTPSWLQPEGCFRLPGFARPAEQKPVGAKSASRRPGKTLLERSLLPRQCKESRLVKGKLWEPREVALH